MPPLWGRCEPYVQLVCSLLPQTSGVVLFDPKGQLRRCSEPSLKPGILAVVELGIIQSIEQMNRTGSNRIPAAAELRLPARKRSEETSSQRLNSRHPERGV
jgi:hypothetical protein